jgi:hypothetical protein
MFNLGVFSDRTFLIATGISVGAEPPSSASTSG